jgi:hypothetical protein
MQVALVVLLAKLDRMVLVKLQLVLEIEIFLENREKVKFI